MLITKEKLARMLKIASKAVSSKSTLPVLEGVRIFESDGHLTVQATNLENGISITTDLTPDDTKAVDYVLPIKTFLPLIDLWNDDLVTIKIDGNAAILKGKSSKSKILGYEGAEFPPMMSERIPLVRWILSEGDWERICSLVPYAAATNADRPVLNACHFAFRGDKLTVESADGFRLAKLELSGIENHTNNVDETVFDLIIPLMFFAKIAPVLPKGEITITGLKMSGIDNDKPTLVSFSVMGVDGEVTAFSALIEGTYPSVTSVVPLPDTLKIQFDVPREKFEKSLTRGRIFASENMRVTLAGNKEKGRLLVISESEELGTSQDIIEIENVTSDFVVTYNNHFIKETASKMKGDKIHIEFEHSQKPTKVTSPETVDYMVIIMPMHIEAMSESDYAKRAATD